jgi:hypothetical protein
MARRILSRFVPIADDPAGELLPGVVEKSVIDVGILMVDTSCFV